MIIYYYFIIIKIFNKINNIKIFNKINKNN